MRATVRIDGLPELIRRLREDAGLAKPLGHALNTIGFDATKASQHAAPVNFGKLRDSITYQVDHSPLPTFVRIGTIGSEKPAYAAYMEFGTGLRHDHPNWPRKPHKIPTGRRTPPGLKLWAKRTGNNPYAIAGAINAAGGLAPRRYLRGPFEANRARYVRTIEEALRRMALG